MSRITGKGSFRGVPFLIEEDQSINGGRRLVSHEYPLRNEGLVEDLGKKQRSYDVNCLVIGDDYLAQAERLISALEGDGKGTLKHPFFGEKEVFVETYSCVSSSSALRVSHFAITFLPAVNQLAPQTTEDTLFGVLDSYTKSLDRLAEEFGEFTDEIVRLIESTTDNGLYRLLDAALNFAESNVQHIYQVIGAGKTVRKKLNSLKNRLTNLIREPKLLAKALQELFKSALEPNIKRINHRQQLNHYQVALTVIGQAKKAPSMITKNDLQQQNILKGLKTQTGYTQESLIVSFEQGLQYLAQGTVLLEYGKAVSQSLGGVHQSSHTIVLISKTDITRYTEELNQHLDTFSLQLADSGFWDSYLSTYQFKLALLNDLLVRGQKLKTSRQITLRETTPALVVSFNETGTAKQWQQLCERNNVKHPLFVIGGQSVEVLSE